MTRTSQRSAAAAVLVLLGAGAFWWVAGDEGERNACSGQSGAPTRAASSTAPLSRSMAGAAASSAADVSTDAPAAVKDRFAASPVLEERQTSRQENGATKVSRVRLVRQEDLKYPIVRVVDELVTGPRGTRLQKQTAMVGDHVLISVEDPKLDETVILSRLKDAGATIRRKLPNSPTWLVAFPNPTVDTVPKAIHELTALKPWVRYAEPDYIVHAQATPNDPAFTNLWGMHNTGQNGGAADADIDAPEAWNISTGSAAVLVAVLDTGVDLTHPDLVDNLWVNPAEVANNGVDDDGNGYVDDVRGWDFVGNDNLPSDDHGHGTHCSGTIGAVGHNSTGVAGVCWDVSLVALKFLNAAGNGITSDGVEAVAYATRLGVSVTSNSWSGEEYSQSLKDAIDQANAAGILFVAAAGNSGVNLDLFGAYPAAYTSPNLISVAALTSTDTLADYSNYGLVTTDLGAPGSDIFSTLPGGGYGLKSGTSMAAPHVAGACALIKGRRPQLQHLQIKELIMRTTDATAALSAKTVSGGRLNLHNALAAADDILATPTTDLAASAPPGGPFAPASQTYTLTNYGGTSAPWTAEVDRSWITLSATSGTLAPTQSTQIQVSFNNYAEVLLPADHTATITIFNTVTGRTQRRQVKLRILPPALYSFTLDTDPGWQRTGQWSYGVPAGQGGTTFGKADPQSGATGSHVFGINLEGDYALEAGPPQYLVAGPFDLSAHHGTILRFQRWLNSDYQDWVYATLEVSTDQQVWHPVWDNGREMQIASKWTEVSYDISAHADGHSQVYVRWGHEIRNATAFPLSGWNLDDIQLIAVPDRQLHLSLPESVSEGQAGALAKIISVPAAATPLLVSLTSDRPGQEAAFPETVTIPANQEETTFTVAAIDDNQVDGTQTVTLTVSGPNRPSHSASMAVHDNESASLTLVLPAAATEGTGPSVEIGEVHLASALTAAITVHLASSDTSELGVPASVTIPAGEIGATFPITIADDDFIDGTQTVTVTAAVTGWPLASSTMTVLDNESAELTLTVPQGALESAGVLVNAGVLRTSAPVENDLTVSLVSRNTGRITVPPVATIFARTSTAVFSLTLQNNTVLEGAQSVEIQASAPGFGTGTGIILIQDDEAPASPSNPSPAHGATSVHPDSDLAWQIDSGSGGQPSAYHVYFGLNPQPTAGDFIGTTSATTRTLPRLTAGTRYYWQIVTRKGTATRAGPVWSFTVAPVGSAKRLAWQALPTSVAVGAPFSARITAYDEFDNPATSFTGNASLTPLGGGPDTLTGSGATNWEMPLATFFKGARTQSIYKPGEVGAAGSLTSLALDVTVPPGQALNGFTIRLKHTNRNAYASGGQQGWESTGWTTVYQQNTTIAAAGWNWFVFTTPFQYDGVQNLMVDISFKNSFHTSYYGRCNATPMSENRSLYYFHDEQDPLAWGTTFPTVPLGSMSASLPNLRLRRTETPVSISPAVIGPFVDGAWSGDVALGAPGNVVRIQAQALVDPSVTGLSDAVDVVSVASLTLNSEPPFTGGSANTISWQPTGSGHEYEVQYSLTADFSSPISSGFVSTSGHTFSYLIDGRTYYYRGRVRTNGVAGVWSAPVHSTQDATPPTLQFTPASGGIVLGGTLTLHGSGADLTSGVASLTLNGIAAVTSDHFHDWQWDLNALPDGVTTIEVTVHDQAVPPNVRTETWSTTRISNIAADADHNGIGALMEYAFNAAGSHGFSVLPQATPGIDPETDERCLNLTFRRRINATGLDYLVETSCNLVDWQPVGADADTLSVTPAGDGVTEVVSMRIRPPDGVVPCFARVRVVVP